MNEKVIFSIQGKSGCFKTSFLLLFLSFCILSCRKDFNPSISPNESSTTIVPGYPLLHTFEVTVIDSTAGDASITWTSAVDNQHDSIVYDVLIDNIEIAKGLKSRKYTFTKLSLATKYHVQIKAIDKKSNSILVSFDFIKYDGFLKYSKLLLSDNSATNLIITNDKGYLLSTVKHNTVGNDLLLIKLDSLGNIMWSNTYKYNGAEIKMSVINDGYLVMGFNYILKVDSRGTLLWGTQFERYGTHLKSFVETNKHEIIIAGTEDTDKPMETVQVYASLIKLSAGGAVILRKKFGTTVYNPLTDIIKGQNDDEYFILGTKSPPTGAQADFWLFKIDELANIVWEKTYGDSRYDFSAQIKMVGNQLIFGGYSWGSGNNSEMQLFRVDVNGTLLKTISIKNEAFYDAVRSIEPTADNGYIVNTAVGSGNASVIGLFKYDSADKKVWEKRYYPENFYSSAPVVRQTADNGFILVENVYQLFGSGSAATWLLKLNPSGSFE